VLSYAQLWRTYSNRFTVCGKSARRCHCLQFNLAGITRSHLSSRRLLHPWLIAHGVNVLTCKWSTVCRSLLSSNAVACLWVTASNNATQQAAAADDILASCIINWHTESLGSSLYIIALWIPGAWQLYESPGKFLVHEQLGLQKWWVSAVRLITNN